MALQRSSHLGEATARSRPALPLILEDIKLAHTVFAMPFALMGALLAADGLPSLWELTWIVVAVVGARSAAMAFNRLVDAPLDAAHDRTEGRPLPSGKASPRHYKAFIACSIALFELAAWMLNSLAFLLSPVVLAIILGYSYTKRFTRWSHLWLGVALACAPIGAWIAIRGDIALAPLLLGVAVAFWVAGFDTLYACQDVEHDAAMGLQSLPRALGLKGALHAARAFHVLMVVALVGLLFAAGLGWIYLAGVLVAVGLLVYEHILVRPEDLSRLPVAFLHINGLVSFTLLAATGIERIVL
ncbi:MAG: UbiA family prenyltransferase [Nitrospinae bacterium]|nr:UbiA family prenyltransferase [Nitrospinota bacterium]